MKNLGIGNKNIHLPLAEKLKAKAVFSPITESKTFNFNKTITSPIPNKLTAKAIFQPLVEKIPI